jgi:hypothetical protein
VEAHEQSLVYIGTINGTVDVRGSDAEQDVTALEEAGSGCTDHLYGIVSRFSSSQYSEPQSRFSRRRRSSQRMARAKAISAITNVLKILL